MNFQVQVISIIILLTRNAISQFQLEPVNKNNIEGVRGNILSLEWKFKGITETDQVYEANLYFNVTTPITQALICEWNTTSQAPLVTATGRHIFSNRVLVLYKSGVYKFTLTELQYNDTGQYFLKVAVGPKPTFPVAYRKSIIAITKIKAKVFCHGFLPKNLIQNENEELAFSFSLCGDPTLMVMWSFDTSDSYTKVSPVYVNDSDYKYIINLPALPTNMCGNKLYIVAKRSWEEVGTMIRIYINFTPPAIKDIQYVRRQIGCNLVQWTSIDTGNCHVTYTIQYENETGIIGIISGIDDSNQSWCSKPYSGATSIRMWAVYSGNIGTKSPAVPLKDMSNNSVKSSGISLEQAVGIGVGVVAFLLLVLSAFFLIGSKKAAVDGSRILMPITKPNILSPPPSESTELTASQKNATRDEIRSSNEQGVLKKPQHAEIMDFKPEEGDGNNNNRIIRRKCQKKIIKERNESSQELHQDAEDNRPMQLVLPAKFTQLEQTSQPGSSNFIKEQPDYENQRSSDLNKSTVKLNDYTELTVEGTAWNRNEYEQLKESQPDASSGPPNFIDQPTDYEKQRSNDVNKSAVEPNDYTALNVEGTDWDRNEYKQLKESQPDASSGPSSFVDQPTDYEKQRSNDVNKSAVEPNNYTALTVEGTDWARNEYKQLKK